MLVKFSVENFKSIREEQTLSMVASNYEKEHPENVIELDIPGMKDVNLLRSAVIYGPNASGKSNVLKAFEYMRWLVLTSTENIKPANKMRIDTFLLDESWRHQPSTFEVTLVLFNEYRVDYGFKLTADRVQEEWLIVYPKGRPVRMFERWVENGKDEYKFSSQLKFKKGLEIHTRPDALFLTFARMHDISELANIYNWFQTNLRNLNLLAKSTTTQESAFTSPHQKERILEQLGSADLGVIDIDFGFELKGSDKFVFTQLVHRMNNPEKESESIAFNRNQESAGTIRLYDLLGPWLKILDIGLFGFLDEIDSSLHPHLVRKLIEMFHSEKWNNQGAQLLFTTHDSTLLSADLFRRDQIWFTEKKFEGNTVLYSLSEFKTRPGEALQKGYLAGRYGAIPFFGPEIENND